MKIFNKFIFSSIFILFSAGFFYNFSIWKSNKKNKSISSKKLKKNIKQREPETVEGESETIEGKAEINEKEAGANKSNNNNKVNRTYPDFVYAAQIATEAVVHIKAIQESKVFSKKRERSPFDHFIEKFYNEKLPDIEKFRSRPKVGIGSGVILSSEGHIVTNNHVIDGADKIEVTLYDNNKYKAKIIGKDTSTDLAIIKIDRTSLPHIKIGISDDIKVGEWVLAVGNPLGLNSTVTAGIVSAKDRSRNELNPRNKMEIGSFIQTDAAINIGNSGGALVDLKGNLIGINTAIMAPTGVFAGYGFAVPSKIVKKVWIDIVKYGAVQKGLLNITGISVSTAKEMLEQNKFSEGIIKNKLKDALTKYKKSLGVLIVNVIKNKAAFNAGLKEYDIIVGINEKNIETMSQLQEILIGEHMPGDIISLSYIRKGVKRNAKIILETNTKYRVIKKAGKFTTNNIEGAIFEDLIPKFSKKYKINGGVVLKTLEKGKWQTAGIKEGFIITTIVHLDATKKHVPITNIKVLCSELNSLIDNRIVIEGIYPNNKNKKEIFALYW